MKNSKKVLRIIVVVIIIIAILAVGIFASKMISSNIKIKETEEKLSNINAEKLQNQIIEELKHTDLNVTSKENSMEITTSFDEGIKFKGYISAIINCLQNEKIISTVEIPCFKINSNNGKLKNIEYTHTFMGSNIIDRVVKDVLKNNYGLDNIDTIIGSEKYRKFCEIGTSGTIYYSEDEFFLNVVNEIKGPIQVNGHDYVFNASNCQRIIDLYKGYQTTAVGLDFKENDGKTNYLENVELSDISYSGARFKIKYSDLKEKCNNVGINNKSYEIEQNVETYNNDVTTDMWCFKGFRNPTLEERAIVGSTSIPYDAYYFKITYEKSTQMVIEVQLMCSTDLEEKYLNEMYKNYSIILGCIDNHIYNNIIDILEINKSPYTEQIDNIGYFYGVFQASANSNAMTIISTACSKEEYEYWKNNNYIWKKQTSIQDEDIAGINENTTDTNEEQLYEDINSSSSQISNSENSNYRQNNNSNNNDYNYDSNNNGNNNQQQEKNIQMPNVIGMSTSQAEQKLNELGIAYNISSITSLSKDNVFYQSIAAGTSKPKSQFGTVTLKAYRKVSQVSANITVSSSNYNGKTIKVLINGKECKDMMGNTTFNGKYSVMSYVNNPNVSVEVYIDNSLVKSQSINLDQISEKNGTSSNEISTTINI